MPLKLISPQIYTLVRIHRHKHNTIGNLKANESSIKAKKGRGITP